MHTILWILLSNLDTNVTIHTLWIIIISYLFLGKHDPLTKYLETWPSDSLSSLYFLVGLKFIIYQGSRSNIHIIHIYTLSYEKCSSATSIFYIYWNTSSLTYRSCVLNIHVRIFFYSYFYTSHELITFLLFSHNFARYIVYHMCSFSMSTPVLGTFVL